MSGLMLEMVRLGVYKRTQGKITRQVTFGALFIALAVGCWELSKALVGSHAEGAAYKYFVFKYAIPGVLLFLGAWFCFRLVNYPTFADFLIAVEAEMAKVNWPSRRELFRASAVVLVTMFALALILFVYDMVWRAILYDVLNISNK